MVVDGDGGVWLDQACCFAPGGGLPVVLAFFQRNPGGQRLVEIRGQRENIRLVHAAQVNQALVGGSIVVQLQAVLRKDIANVLECNRRQAVGREFCRRSVEDLREVHDGVARDGKGKLGLPLASAFDANHNQSAGIKDS